jgi:hypothetical protein
MTNFIRFTFIFLFFWITSLLCVRFVILNEEQEGPKLEQEKYMLQ